MNRAVEALKAEKLREWKQENGYHESSLSETAMYRYKRLISGKLSLCAYNGQIGEIMAGVGALNKMLSQGESVNNL